MVVAGRVTEAGDVAIMMVEAESTPKTLALLANIEESGAVAPTEETVAQGLEAAKPFIKVLCEAQQQVASQAAKPTQEFPIFLDYTEDAYEDVASEFTHEPAKELTLARPGQGAGQGAAGRPVRGQGQGDQRRVPVADQEAGPGADHPRRRPHRRPWPGRHPPAVGRDARDAPGARLGPVPAR